MATTRVLAEAAPVNVLLERVSAEAATDYTLFSVSVVREGAGEHVLWTYQNGRVRRFAVGEQVTVELGATA